MIHEEIVTREEALGDALNTHLKIWFNWMRL